MATAEPGGQCDDKRPEDSNPTREIRKNDATFTERFAALYNNERLSDIVLRVGDDRYHAHKFMLIVSSDVFSIMLGESRWREGGQSEVELTEEPPCVPVFPDFLKYIYTGSVTLTTDTVLPILLLADKYSIQTLGQTCVDYMLQHVVETPDTNRTLSWYHYAKVTMNTVLIDKCRIFILTNVDIIMKTTDWMHLSQDELTDLISSNQVIVNDEFYLWEKVEQWLTSDLRESTLADDLQEVIPHIRFTMIPPKHLLSVEGSRLYQEHTAAFSGKLNAAYRHHSLALDNVGGACSTEKFRNYMDDMYGISTAITIKGYRNVEHMDSKISKRMTVPFAFVPSGHTARNENQAEFRVEFWPMGAYKTFSWYGSLTDDARLSLQILNKKKESVIVSLTFIVYGEKNGARYVSFAYSTKHTFSAKNSIFVEDNLLPLKELKDEKSAHLINGNLEARIFVKVENIVPPEENTK
ncbi:BTBDH-like protein [Mya arenaria]|uniref:BTBDH-like protein n=1 Tax=Mya arenaria TaxID=6604 RepID=A0ABY7EA54_MYAAR|nr:BTB/POZ domain-containing protein 17-like [Mya arenaria]WAR06922.1 BTBDH-like protein [Mya arenaria]